MESNIFLLFLLLLNIVIVESESDSVGLCETRGCKCLDLIGGWKKANCTFTKDQDVVFGENSIHKKIEEIFIIGGSTIEFRELSANALKALYILEISHAKNVVLKKNSFYNSSSASLRLKVGNCDNLTIESEAFINSNATEFIEVNHARYSTIFSAAFSKLLNATFRNIHQLNLDERTFEIKKKDGIVRHHGAATTIIFDYVKIPRIPTETFFSPLAEIRIENCEIGEVDSKAFSAPQITSINLKNSTIKTVRAGACSINSLIFDLNLKRCNISKLETNAFLCAISFLNILYSKIKTIENAAFNTTAGTINLIGNEIIDFKTSAMILYSWNKIQIEQNIIKNLGSNAISGNPVYDQTEVSEFSFINNDVYNLNNSALGIISRLSPESKVNFRDNFFHIKCSCNLNKTMENLLESGHKIEEVLNSSFCLVDDLLARCYELKTGSINMLNFTELVCAPGDLIKCEHYNGAVLNSSHPPFFDKDFDQNDGKNSSWLILSLTILGLVIITIVATLIFLLISGSRWLKRKGYLFRNIHYNPNSNEISNDEETIVTLDQNTSSGSEKFNEIPEELTLEYLELLKKRLDDPNLHQETSEMIERLYEMFIIEDNYENNNRERGENNDEAHLYEELAAMQNNRAKSVENLEDGPLGILKLMEERFNLQFIDNLELNNVNVNEYSEPSDAAIHVYSELKTQNGSNSINKRPLPDKPGTSGTSMSNFD